MSDDTEDKSSRTEEPTERKLQQARDQGNVPQSREVNNFFVLLAMIIALALTLPHGFTELLSMYASVLQDAGHTRMDTVSSSGSLMSFLTWKTMVAFLPTFLVLMALGLFGGLIQTGFLLTPDIVMPKLERISPFKGFGRIFSIRSLAELVKSTAKLGVIGAVVYSILKGEWEHIISLWDIDLLATIGYFGHLLIKVMGGILAVVFLLAVMDFVFQRAQFTKDQRMTRHELKEEFKDTEGDPHIKQRQRQLRQERARARMMKELPTADVVVTNPTHFAVALRYDKEKEAAPRVVAKGSDHLALRIREVAGRYDIPLYEDPPLARQLFASVEVGDEVSLDLYEAVAKVIAFVYKLRKEKRGG